MYKKYRKYNNRYNRLEEMKKVLANAENTIEIQSDIIYTKESIRYLKEEIRNLEIVLAEIKKGLDLYQSL
jgi:hypothetical protein